LFDTREAEERERDNRRSERLWAVASSNGRRYRWISRARSRLFTPTSCRACATASGAVCRLVHRPCLTA